ncbi:MAG TPA: sialidase family protein, partial [Candidatus Thermoplasmatota archaeon]|nr:sialidase family protein [Candidatus Thermoplasmatota archaeon]
MRSPRLPLLLAALLVAPVLGPLASLAPPAAAAAAASAPPPAFTMHPAPVGSGAAEPTLGVNWNTGNVLFQNFATTYRVVFDDNVTPPLASWQNVRAPLSIINIDPILFTDSVKGRTFAGGLNGECSVLMYTDNDGQSWNAMGNPCASPAFDHQTIGSGPWKEPRPATARWDRAVYYCAQASAVQCARSDDGGITFGPGVPVTCGYVNPGLHGSVHVGPNGHAWLPFRNGQNQICVARSTDNGVSWTGIKMPGSASPSNGFDPDVATSANGWVYVGYPSGGNAASPSTVRVALSKDNGASWTVSPDLGASFGLKVTTFHEMVAGDDQRAALAFLGTTECCVQQAFTSTAFAGAWHLYVAFTYDGGATWTTVRASDDPVQRGCIWDGGGSHACRNLLDFMDAQVDQKGRVVVGFADGCRDACALPGGTPSQSRSDWATIARQAQGMGLFAAHDGNATLPLTVEAGGPYAGFVGGAVAIAGEARGGSPPYASTWSVASAPAGSLAAAANPNALSTTFTPDVPGTYTLVLTVTDGAGLRRNATATLTAAAVTTGGACGTTGVLVSRD